MVETRGKDIIIGLKKRWTMGAVLSNLLISLGLAALYATLLYTTGSLKIWWSIPFLLAGFYWMISVYRSTSVTEKDVSRFLNSLFPELEESSALLLKPYDSLTTLEKLQLRKVDQALQSIRRPSLNKRILQALALFLLALIACVALTVMHSSFGSTGMAGGAKVPGKPSSLSSTEKLPASVSAVSIRIIPPAYTASRSREHESLNLTAEQGANVVWQISTSIPVKQVKLVFNDNKTLELLPLNVNHTTWKAQKPVNNSGFYQVQTEEKISGFYKIEMISDKAPVIRMQAPAPNTVIEPGESRKVLMKLALSDDYGISSANVFATIASGSGEAVKFKEQQLGFTGFQAGGRQYQLQKTLDLSALGLSPGDELYYYVTAMDNNRQESRSDIYIISIPDTAELLSLEGMTSGVNLVPEYFRSQRQIIIETEQLIRDRDTISIEKFNSKSNELGTDQKLLRLRYGKFLGEETDTEIGDDHEHEGENHEDPADFGNAARIMDAYSHKHDNAEDATFFEPAIKAQLKATLSEMWKAELQLRIYKPQQALPFEYKALRLLKDLQQKSRAYVAKTSFKTTPLKPEKRLTGDLTKIVQPVAQRNYEQKTSAATELRKAVSNLELIKSGKPLTIAEVQNLKVAATQLSNKAAAQPALYLNALAAMQRVLDKVDLPSRISSSDILLVENALQQIIPVTPVLPASPVAHPALNLPRQYFKNLNSQ